MDAPSHLVFICTPAIGNLVPAVEFALRFVHHDSRFFATFLIFDLPERPLVNAYTQSRLLSTASTSQNLQFIHLPLAEPPSPDLYHSFLGYFSLIVETYKPKVKCVITDLLKIHHSHRIVGIFVDMFTTAMIDVANDLGVPSYLFFASPATFLSLMIHLPKLEQDRVSALFHDSDAELVLPSFAHPLTPALLPTSLLKTNDGHRWYMYHGRRYLETKGIVINTFTELETHALSSLEADGIPPVYAVGPILDLAGPAQWHPSSQAEHEGLMKWLDDQPPSSVVLLSFGSMGSLEEAQVREIAFGLQRAGLRFVWAVREPPKAQFDSPNDYSDKLLNDVLPEGFSDVTAGVGLVCGWVPQVTILAHPAIGGFVSHCGWNSILESLWYGVPIATWPVYAEQQMNAFEMVRELGLAVELRLDYRNGSNLVSAEELERGLRRLMDEDNEVRSKVKRMGETSKRVLMENGSSSYLAFNSFVHKLTAQIL